jgi:hypothetical protein
MWAPDVELPISVPRLSAFRYWLYALKINAAFPAARVRAKQLVADYFPCIETFLFTLHLNLPL